MRHPFAGRWRLLPCTLVLLPGMAGLAACQQAGEGAAVLTRASAGQPVLASEVGLPGLQDGAGDPAGGAGLPLPDDFPGDVYLPSGYTVSSVMALDGTDMVAMTAPGRVSALFADARGSMRAQGWTQTTAAQHSVDNAVLTFAKDKRHATLSFSQSLGSPGVVMSVQLRQFP